MTHQGIQTEETREIVLRLEHYDDIFSDFDMRPYSKRSLSVDFLSEIKRATVDKDKSGIELVLFAPEKERNESHEVIIRERLDAHFKRHFDLLKAEKQSIVRRGAVMATLGLICMVGAMLLVYRDPEHTLLTSFMLIFLEPASWFLLWEGMDQIVFHSKNINPELDFYRKMSFSHGHIHFRSHESL